MRRGWRLAWLMAVVMWPLATHAADTKDGWSLDKDGHGVKVYTRSAKGYSLKAFRAETRVKAPLHAMVALIADGPSFTHWYTDCSRNDEIKSPAPRESIMYFVNDSPFPVMDRDSIIHTVVSQDPTTKAVKFAMKGVPDFMPEKSSYVRVPRLEGFWLMTPVNDQETDVVLEMATDTGGSVPSFLANQQVTSAPYKTFVKMRTYVQKPRYLGAKVDFETAKVTYGK